METTGLPRFRFGRLLRLLGFTGLLAVFWHQPALADQPRFLFESRLTEDAYQNELRRLDPERLDPMLVANSPFPTWGVGISRITPGSLAEQAGLKAGSVLDRMNGAELWDHRQIHTAKEHVIEAVLPDGTRQTFTFGAGKMGIRTGNRHRPEKYLLQQLPRGAWDTEMLVASQAWQLGRNDVAETALHRAIEKGMPWNIFCSYYGAQLALDRGDDAEASSMLKALLGETPADDPMPRYFRPGIRSLAFSLHDYGLLRKAITDQRGLEDELQDETVAAWQKWDAAGSRASLLAAARAGQGPDVMPVVTQTTGVRKTILQDLASFQTGRHREAGEPGKYWDHLFSPPTAVSDFIWEMRVAFEETGSTGSVGDFINDLSFSLVDLRKMTDEQGWDPLSWSAARFSIWHYSKDDHFIRLSANPGSEAVSVRRFVPRMSTAEVAAVVRQCKQQGPVAAISASSSFKLTFIRIGAEVEILVNDRTFLHLPIDPSIGPLACEVHNVGMALSLEQMTLRPIFPKPPQEKQPEPGK